MVWRSLFLTVERVAADAFCSGMWCVSSGRQRTTSGSIWYVFERVRIFGRLARHYLVDLRHPVFPRSPLGVVL